MLHSVFALVALLVHGLVIAGALGFGGKAERLGGGVLALSACATILAQDRRYESTDLGLAMIDLLQLVAFVLIAKVTGRRWALIASALTLSGLFIHAAKFVHGDAVHAFPYLTLYALVSYLVLCSLAVGTISAVGHKLSDRRFKISGPHAARR